ncbi:hypothetical protein IG631_09623 [Alternaria alternata]|nr:hypothetical protein IG631_09623 [Alternaria alternata]
MSCYWLSQARRGGGGGMRVHGYTLLVSQLIGVYFQQAAALSALLPRNSLHFCLITDNGGSDKQMDHKKMEVSIHQ